ncbi:hypothetical protein ERO13_A03G206100v2 [Gossypium hirsutum]|uniref:Uncharacterized protein n=5 Tax=Gossypium TaxID=3633 RepID=A0A2P5XZH5_GOSBA|nr:hypothetical protein [Gossypium barbadense]KAG4209531.1 hypothetical protein ERO13_A03G206100v2 [Gossypium hirsutum]KAK5837746.1 hypothetical protein PVK06_006473 [Gossypium arboreum]TYH26395.1 hypothetical protein ES288_A03G248900v1 [Gossypium darwinii]TYI37845.1 hypothetical protein ES332_A03G243300v1 [Gossypium tomentosum]TYJ44456.1 hypothetical protein E1A91_A03G226100v1 [Gossypium mustelinum]
MEGKASPKRDFKQSKSRNQKSLTRSSNNTYLLEAIANASNNRGGGVVSHIHENGALRVKIVVKKQDLRQMLGIINGGTGKNNNNYYYQSSPPSISVEERLNLLRKKQLLRSNAIKKKSRHCWSPELQSIPEE